VRIEPEKGSGSGWRKDSASTLHNEGDIRSVTLGRVAAKGLNGESSWVNNITSCEQTPPTDLTIVEEGETHFSEKAGKAEMMPHVIANKPCSDNNNEPDAVLVASNTLATVTEPTDTPAPATHDLPLQCRIGQLSEHRAAARSVVKVRERYATDYYDYTDVLEMGEAREVDIDMSSFSMNTAREYGIDPTASRPNYATKPKHSPSTVFHQPVLEGSRYSVAPRSLSHSTPKTLGRTKRLDVCTWSLSGCQTGRSRKL
jgi:hypothetical protein